MIFFNNLPNWISSQRCSPASPLESQLPWTVLWSLGDQNVGVLRLCYRRVRLDQFLLVPNRLPVDLNEMYFVFRHPKAPSFLCFGVLQLSDWCVKEVGCRFWLPNETCKTGRVKTNPIYVYPPLSPRSAFHILSLKAILCIVMLKSALPWKR